MMIPITNISVLILIVFPLITNGNKESTQDKKKGGQCSYACGNYVEFLFDNITISAIEKLPVRVSISWVSEGLNGAIMSREKYWHVIYKKWGPKTKSLGRKFLHPNKEEAKEWYEENKCKIGVICPPSGDCWGTGSDTCYSDLTENWVKGNTFHYLNMEWITDFRETCVLDWQCQNIRKVFPFHFDSTGKRYVVVNEDKILISNDLNEGYFPFKDYVLYFPYIPAEKTSTTSLECFTYKKDVLCESEEGEYVLFQDGTKCTSLGSKKFCLEEGSFDKIRDFGAGKYASVSDLNQVRDALIVNQEKDNYNSYVLWKKIINIQEIILKLMSSLSKNNPNILNEMLKGSYFARYLNKNIFEICNCEEDQDCKTKEFHHPDVRFCTDNITPLKISPFKVSQTLDFSIGDKFKFQGKDVHIEETLVEADIKGSDFQQESNDRGLFESLMSGFNPLSGSTAIVSWIALGLSVLNFLRR